MSVSVGMIFAVFSLEEALRPLALRAREGGFSGGRMVLMLGLSYQLVPVFLQSLEGVALAQRAGANLWWLRPSRLTRAASSVFLLSHRLSEELVVIGKNTGRVRRYSALGEPVLLQRAENAQIGRVQSRPFHVLRLSVHQGPRRGSA